MKSHGYTFSLLMAALLEIVLAARMLMPVSTSHQPHPTWIAFFNLLLLTATTLLLLGPFRRGTPVQRWCAILLGIIPALLWFFFILGAIRE